MNKAYLHCYVSLTKDNKLQINQVALHNSKIMFEQESIFDKLDYVAKSHYKNIKKWTGTTIEIN